ncbi:hypothetical protein F4781DRAFT_434474 [Annulohypoxylon bovei var. microspora]|nr:hypothetical protein F4781DRAFT_434474 [Annulohypoxylon bovei var. microspora]
MALATVYKRFLAAPDSTLLADGATLNYITTTTSFKGPDEIGKHFTTSARQLNKKKQDFLSVVEGQNVIAVEVDTVLEFLTSGGAYLPGLDDNFLADRTVYLPIIHIVTFDNDGKIQQIRQAWDQGSLLKQLDVIGKSGRNWPIRDSTEQIRLIETSVKSSISSSSNQDPDDFAVRSRGNSTNVLRDPHASLALFAPREESDAGIDAVISPRGGVRPRQRDFAEIFGDEPVESPSRERSESPSKAIAPKAGAEKKFQPSRLFEDEDIVEESNLPDAVASPSRFIKPNPKKYSHFDFVDGTDEAPQAFDPSPKKTKHSSQWCFDDFNTPHKAKPSKVLQVQKQNVRHWGTEDDEVQESPVRKVAPVKPRRDAETHFEFVDDGAPTGEARAARPRGATHNSGLGLYENNLYSDDGSKVPDDEEEPRALGAITNLKDRGRDFEAHWQMTDSPNQKASPKPPVGEDRKKVVKMMDASWSNFDQSPAQKENKPIPGRSGTNDERGIRIGGDGMGGGRGSNRNWLFGDEGDGEPKQAPQRKQGAANTGGFNWDF